ncbi:ATP-binding cassette domain-containing protein [Acidobacteriota bacterium]
MMEKMIKVESLRKEFKVTRRKPGLLGALRSLFSFRYRLIHAIDDISFAIDKGELVGFIGPNGAGKSTTIKVLTGILHPTSGQVEVNGVVPHKARKRLARRIGVVFGQRTQLWWDLPLLESLNLLRWIYSVPEERFKAKLEQLVTLLDLEDFLHTPVRKLSLGQRVRGDLTAALLHEPRILFLDEPTIGLDVNVRDRILDFIRDINKKTQATVLFTSHDLNNIERICERIMVIDRGRVIFDGPRAELKGMFGPIRKAVVQFAEPVEQKTFDPDLVILEAEGYTVEVEFSLEKISVKDFLAGLERYGNVTDLSISDPSIETIIKKLLGSR